MEVSETLKKAWAAVEDAGLPDHLHEVAFREAVRLLVPVSVVSTAVPVPHASGQSGKSEANRGDGAPGGSGGGNRDNDESNVFVDEGTLLDKVAQNTGVTRDKLGDLVHLDDGVLKISLPGIKLGRNNSDKTRAIAQILTIVRGFGFDEDETSLELVRAEAQRLKCYDSANFSSQVKVLTGYLITGSGANRRIRAKSAGIKAFPAFVDSLLSES